MIRIRIDGICDQSRLNDIFIDVPDKYSAAVIRAAFAYRI